MILSAVIKEVIKECNRETVKLKGFDVPGRTGGNLPLAD